MPYYAIGLGFIYSKLFIPQLPESPSFTLLRHRFNSLSFLGIFYTQIVFLDKFVRSWNHSISKLTLTHPGAEQNVS